VDGQVVALLVQNLERLDENVKEEADGVHNTLDNRELLGELDGIDVLLQQLSVFKRHNPSTAEEQEMMENLFDSLCSSLMLSSNRDRFLKGEGLQLMNLMLRSLLANNNKEKNVSLDMAAAFKSRSEGQSGNEPATPSVAVATTAALEKQGLAGHLMLASVFGSAAPDSSQEGSQPCIVGLSVLEEISVDSEEAARICSSLFPLSHLLAFQFTLPSGEKKISRSSALKVLDHAMIGPEGADNCHKFVDILGLRTIFPLFMKSPKKIKKVGSSEKEHEEQMEWEIVFLFLWVDSMEKLKTGMYIGKELKVEHVCSILASLLRNLRGQQRTRLLNKFTENDSEKVDRLMELYFKYLDAVQVADKKIEGEKHSVLISLRGASQEPIFELSSPISTGHLAADKEWHLSTHLQDVVGRGEIIDDDMEDEFYLRRLDAGLFVLQLICYITAEICNANIPQYAENIGDGKNPEFQESEQKRIVELLENF
ncbi:hypothetical protein JD844_019363, partial [Phrynosoma platyrhinos]